DGRGHLRRPAVRHRRRPAAVRLPAPARCREVQRGGRPRLCGGGSPAVAGARAAPPGAGRRASASRAAGGAARPLAQSLFAVGRCGMQAKWSNQAVTFDSSLGGTVEILRMPSMSGSAADAELWYKASMYFAVAAGSPNEEAAAAFVDWMVNSPEGRTTLLAERRVPRHVGDR